jgi:TMEM70/TMEM186/TMEM223 protein family
MLNLLRQCSRNGSFHLPKYYRQLQQLPDLRPTPIGHKRILPAFHHCQQFSSSPVKFCHPKDSPPTAPDGLIKVYYGVLTPQIKAVKVFSLSSSILGVIAQPVLLEQGSKIGGLPMVVALCGFVGFFTFVTPLLLHWITKKYITELHYDARKDEYVATTVTFFLRQKKVSSGRSSSMVFISFVSCSRLTSKSRM